MSRALRVAAIVWVAVITVRYVGAVQKSLLNPFNEGFDLAWLGLLLAFVALVSVSLAWGHTRALIALAAALAILAIAILFRSGALASALVALWVLAAATVCGDLVLVRLGLNARDNLIDRFVIALPLGIVALGTATLALALAGVFTSTVVWILLIAVTLAELRRAAAMVRDVRRRSLVGQDFLRSVPEAPFLLLVMGFSIVRNLLWAVAPEVEFDALNMRLSVPQMFLREGRFIDVPYIWHSYFVHLLEYFHGFCMALHGIGAAKLAVAGIAIAAAFSVYSLGRLVFSPRAGLWAAVFFYTTPLVSWGAGTAYNDNAVAGFLTASLVAFLLWYRSQQSGHNGWLIASALLAGGSIAIKLNATYAVLALCTVLLSIAFRSGRFRIAALFLGLVGLVASPWYLLVYALTGNPIFPLMNGIFKSPLWDINNTLMNAADFGIGTSLYSLGVLPFWLTLDTSRFGEALTRGSVGPLLLVLIPFGFMRLRVNREARILAFVVCVYFVLWTFSFQYGRYYTAVLPAIAVLAVGGFLHGAPPLLERLKRLPLAVLLIAQMAVLPTLYWRIPERFPILLALGLESGESLLQRGLQGYSASQYLNTVARPGERVLAIGFEDVRLYLKPPLETLSESRVGSPLRHAVGLGTPNEVAGALSEEGIAYILLSPQDLANPPASYPYAKAEFLNQFTTLEYSDAGARVFHLKH